MRKFFNEQSDKRIREKTDSEFSNLERKKKKNLEAWGLHFQVLDTEFILKENITKNNP